MHVQDILRDKLWLKSIFPTARYHSYPNYLRAENIWPFKYKTCCTFMQKLLSCFRRIRRHIVIMVVLLLGSRFLEIWHCSSCFFHYIPKKMYQIQRNIWFHLIFATLLFISSQNCFINFLSNSQKPHLMFLSKITEVKKIYSSSPKPI